MQPTRICNYCKQTKPLSEFYRDIRCIEERRRICKKCHSEKQRRYYYNHHDKRLIYERMKRRKKPDVYKAIMKKRDNKLRMKALQIISGKEQPICQKCGCANFNMLEVHHLDGNGKQDRKNRAGWTLFRHIRDGKENPSKFSVFCKLCNLQDFLEKKFNEHWVIKHKSHMC